MPKWSFVIDRNLINSIGGANTLMWRGEPLPMPMFCLFYEQSLRDDVVRNLTSNGVGSFALRNVLGVGDSSESQRTLEDTVERIANVARLAPHAALMPDMLLFPCDQWLIDNPHECFITADNRVLVMGAQSQVEGITARRDFVTVPGPTIADAQGQMINGEKPEMIYGRRRVSPFSKLFAEEAARTVLRLLDKLEQRGLLPHLWGTFIECYNCGEWNLGMNAPDHSAAAVAGFRAFLANRYGDNPETTNAIPPARYDFDDRGGLRLVNRQLEDYMAAEADALGSQFLHIAGEIRQRHTNLAVGGFYPGVSRYQSQCLDLYRDPAITFVATPQSYEQRGPRGAVVSQSLISDSMTALGKVWWDELDTVLHTSNPKKYQLGNRPIGDEQSVELLWRDAGQMLARGHAGWWLDFGSAKHHKTDLAGAPPYTWHSTPRILAFHKQFAAIWNRLDTFDRTCVAQCKVFTPSVVGRRLAGYHQALQRQLEWSFAGVPLVYDCLENLLDGTTTPGRLNIIFGAQHLEEAELAALSHRAAATRDWWLWWYGTGIADANGSIDPSRAQQLHGIEQHYIQVPSRGTGRLTDRGACLLGTHASHSIGDYGRHHNEAPMCDAAWRLVARDAEALAVFEDEPSQVAIASRSIADGPTHVAYNLPVINTAALRGLARAAGCHVYIEQDHFLYASRGLLMLHTHSAQTVHVALPTCCDIHDLREPDRKYAPTQQLELSAPAGHTYLLQLTPHTNGSNQP